MRTIDAIWFTTLSGTIGIVVVEDDVTGKRKAYIGTASGLNEKVDIEHIKQNGSKVSLDVFLNLVSLVKGRGT